MPPIRHSVFRPCIDLHDGQVKQIIGGTLSDTAPENLRTNFVASDSPGDFSRLYKKHNLGGGHVIKLGPGNDAAAREALGAWSGGLQIGGGINDENAMQWLDAGASKVIVTSYLFPNARFSLERLRKISSLVGKDKLVVDLSCRRRGERWVVAMNRWQDMTDMEISQDTLNLLSEYCSEFLVHAADVEGLCQGIDRDLVENLGKWAQIPITYAGGANDIDDLDLVERLSEGRVDLTYGSSLDIFGGTLVKFQSLVDRNMKALDLD
ncbi:Phosphoribosylformimino-5-aminoimidazole carboxamide ribotide isomerase [Collybia sordida]|uniref:1-(5-phosphoribosyl)-5-[(5-phosphoribosylamino)methylideneamino] imidazole-4-carboxamide isomerase n=1 Tax=Collybia sordida TaxID=123925 RepID=A0A9C7UU45_9AGAR|nr:Phosphoribosylformimino-5-aminoimidazole carboxamide ribotide isomerase [Collybia sordida]